MRTHVIAGEQIDHFRVEELVTSTPVASIFRATDLRTEERVLMKFPNPDIETDPILADRFKREEEIGSSLNHPGLLKVIAPGGHSRPYIVSEWFDGHLLRQLLSADERLSPQRAVQIALNICDALDYVENHGVFHRNLRPENIMVGADDSIKLINFGTAAMIGARRITFTSVSRAVGISDYMAPEELGGKRADGRSDIFAVGVILYEMLAGRTPFQGIDPFDRPSKKPEPLSQLAPGISPQLQEVIYRCLEAKPSERYANAHLLSHDLKHLDRVQLTKRAANAAGPKRQVPKKMIVYAVLALVPIVIFALLLLFARG
jgi:eukaryotic-like serine/threonine-protein kinase